MAKHDAGASNAAHDHYGSGHERGHDHPHVDGHDHVRSNDDHGPGRDHVNDHEHEHSHDQGRFG